MIPTASFAFALLVATHDPTPIQIHSAIARALPPLKIAAQTHAEKRTCFACHNQAYPMIAFDAAKALGFELDPEFVRDQVQHLRGFVASHRKDWEDHKGTGGQVDTAGWLLATFEVAGEKPDADTAAMVRYILNRHADRKHWAVSSNRPPTQISSFTTSYLAVRSLKTWGQADDQPAIAKRIDQVREWALNTKPKETQDRVDRLRLLALSGAEWTDVAAAARELQNEQRPDGGWAQLPKATSDPYATATVLTAFAETGTLSPQSTEYRRGAVYLLRTQRNDGTWRVATRAPPIQPYFEAGYPHGKDQFISSSAAAWAVVALAKAWEKSSSSP